MQVMHCPPFFFQAEDGIRDRTVTGVQTCALPISRGEVADTPAQAREIAQRLGGTVVVKAQVHAGGRGKAGGIKLRSEERRVGKECRSPWAPYPDRRKTRSRSMADKPDAV